MFQIVSSKTIILAALACCLCISCKEKQLPLPYYNTPDFTPLFLQKDDVGKKVTHTIDKFSFTDQEGNNISTKDIAGKIHVANFFFTSCGSICPVMMDNLDKVKQAFKDDSDVVMLSFSVTPWIDSATRLKKYAAGRNISSKKWHLLTGDKSVIYHLARQSYFAEEDLGFSKDSSDFLHTEHLLLVDRTNRIRGIYNGTLLLDVEQLIKDIEALKGE